MVHRTCQAIDGGSLAFIASEAGAIVTDFAGAPVPSFREVASRVVPNIVVSVNLKVHERILQALS